MSSAEQRIAIRDVEVRIIRKKMKTVRLAVYPPDGEVRLSVPQRYPEKDIHRLLEEKLPWIEEKRSKILEQQRPELQFVSGEQHYFLGRLYLFELVEAEGRAGVVIDGERIIMKAPKAYSAELRRKVLDEWYRLQLQLLLPEITPKWEKIAGKKAREYRIKKMKTRWGTCNPRDSRIWLNLELMKKPLECIEYVLVHELVHFYERYHNQNFKQHMDRFMPQWRFHQGQLKDLGM